MVASLWMLAHFCPLALQISALGRNTRQCSVTWSVEKATWPSQLSVNTGHCTGCYWHWVRVLLALGEGVTGTG